MIITHLRLKHFMNIAHADLTFQKGINVLSGKNGQGKSAVLEAIAFCLIGRRRGDSWKDYVKSGEKSFKIELGILHENEKIDFIYEGEKNAMALNRKIISKGKTYINSECDSFIESTYDTEMLENVLFTMQDSPSIVSLMPGERRAIFKKVFNTDFVEALDRIKTDQETLVVDKLKVQTELTLLESKQYSLPDSRVEIIDPHEIEDLKLKRLELLDKEASLKTESENALKKKKEIEDRLKEINTKSQQVLLSQSRSVSILSSLNEDQAKNSLKDLEDKISKKRDKIQELSGEISSLKIDVENRKKLGHALLLEELTQKSLAERAKSQLLRVQISTSEKGECTQCGQTCDKTHLENLKNTLTPIDLKISIIENSIKATSESLKELKEMEFDLSLKERDLSSEKKASDYLMEQCKESEESLKELQRKKESLQEEAYSYVQSLSILNNEKVVLSGKLGGIKDPSEELKEVESKLRELQLEILEKESSLRLNEEKMRTIQRIKKEKEEDEVRKKELLILLNNLDIEDKDLSSVRQIYEIHLPNYINQKACELLQGYMSVFLSNTKEDFQVSLQQSKKGIDFLYKSHKDSDWLQAKLASGFESALLTLAFKCAVANAYGAQMIILDEPDKAATESASSQLFQTITEDLNGFDQIFIITHRVNSLEYLQENGSKIYRVHQGAFELYD